MLWVYIVGAIVVVLGASVFFGAPYVPSRRQDIRRMFDQLLPLQTSDVVFDAGSGDGVVLREVSSRGASAIGYEINPVYWFASLLISRKTERIQIKLRNFWLEPFPDETTIVYAFVVSRDARRFEKKIQKERQRLGRPLTVVCYGIPLPTAPPVQKFEAYYLYTF